MKRSKRRRWAVWIAAGTGLAIVLALLGGWLAFQRIPGWYQPVRVADEDALQRIRDDLSGTYDRFNGLLINSHEPFEFRIRQGQINAWLAAREQIWTESRFWLPDELRAPFLAIQEGRVRPAVTFADGDIRTVLNTRLSLSADEKNIFVRLEGVYLGSVPVPRKILREQIIPRIGDRWPTGERIDSRFGGGTVPPLVDFLDGVKLPNEFVWESFLFHDASQPFKVIGLRLEEGEIVLTIQPLARETMRFSDMVH